MQFLIPNNLAGFEPQLPYIWIPRNSVDKIIDGLQNPPTRLSYEYILPKYKKPYSAYGLQHVATVSRSRKSLNPLCATEGGIKSYLEDNTCLLIRQPYGIMVKRWGIALLYWLVWLSSMQGCELLITLSLVKYILRNKMIYLPTCMAKLTTPKNCSRVFE